MRLMISAILNLFTSLCFATDPETLIFSFQKQKNPEELRASIETLRPFLEKEIGKKIEVLVPTSYGVSAQGLISGKIHIAYMDSLPYVLASNETSLEIVAVEKRNGRTEYDSLLVVPANSPVQSIKDLKGKKIAFTSQTSTSGYLFALSRFISEKQLDSHKSVDSYFSQALYAGGYDKALLAVAQGQVDVAAFSDYVLEGTKADLYGNAETRAKVKILARTPGVPTHLIAVTKNLSPELRSRIQTALLKLSQQEPKLLSSVYGAAELVKPKGSEHIASTERALKNAGLEAKAFVK
jgi:phosphonate transport system substrate-binding protein